MIVREWLIILQYNHYPFLNKTINMGKIMQAMQLLDIGQKLELVEAATPLPQNNEIQIRVAAVGINFADILICEGKYQERPDLPFSPGMEVCGVVTGLGPASDGFEIGDQVVGFGSYGGLAEYTTLPQNHCLRIAKNMSEVEAAGFLVAYGTSHLALSHRAGLTANDNLLVLGASGGVGRTAVEIGHLLGANVIAAASSEYKLQEARRSGADHLINTSSEDLLAKVKSLGGADVVYDPVGGELFKLALRATNPEGRIIPIGFASGEIPAIPANILLVKNLTVIGCYWGGYMNFGPDVIKASLKELFDWFEKGWIKPLVKNIFPLADANLALAMLKERKAVGKVVVRIPGNE